MGDPKNDLINITGLWKKTAKSGDTYLTGRWGSVYVTIFANKNKSAENQPDFNLCISPAKMDRTKNEADASFTPLIGDAE